LQRDRNALLNDLVDGHIAVHERGPEVEAEDVLHVGPELDEPGVVEGVEALETELQRKRPAAALELERTSADPAHEREGHEHYDEDQRDGPEQSPDNEGGHAGLDSAGKQELGRSADTPDGGQAVRWAADSAGMAVRAPALRDPVPEIEDLWIPLSDGARLSAHLWLPPRAEPAPLPAACEALA